MVGVLYCLTKTQIFLHLPSSVHKDVTERLELIDYDLFIKVGEVLDFNLSERHIRGGISTKKKFKEW
jgi:putative DeoR family transcriptional regulator (stage III sporulation protein D)